MAVDSNSEQLQIRFVTKDKRYAVANAPFAVPSTISCKELNTLVNELIQEANDNHSYVEFDFLVNGEFLKLCLKEHLELKQISSESVVEVEYIESLPAPEPQDCLLHDDWVSSVHTSPDWILTGCYDNSVQIWSVKGMHQLTVTGHTGPVKTVSWVLVNSDAALFLSGSLDQTAMLWEWKIGSNTFECINIYKGHERNIESLSVSPKSEVFASGGWDSLLKIWPVFENDYVITNEDGESKAKRIKKDNKSMIKTPKMTLKGHRDCISCVTWTSDSEILTASWDHTLKLWDAEIGGIKKELVGNKTFFHCDYSQINRTILTASADKQIRLYDPRSEEGSLVKSTFSSHTQWVQSVRWSKTEENLFISGSYDNLVKLWDWRSPKAPLFDLAGHDDKILGCDWSEPKFMVSGGADNTVRIYKFKNAIKKIDKIQ
ncbi:UNVERIFIED_CONTAM: hypothetical protein PYX00_010029 [Menopon gallinae]|uniref:Ribosome biogenesis protein WDR12 homolog n=1 Tax=Menopon gallinae TaxID=328185 RepID=A0AAW2HDZ4_9NEOP